MEKHWSSAGSLSPLPRMTTSKEDGGVAITHRSVLLDWFGCVGLVLTTIVHRFVWGAYAVPSLQCKGGGPNICKSRSS